MSEFLILGIYSNKGVSAPAWTMQALFKCAGNLTRHVEEAKLPINCDRISPKCWDAYIVIKHNVRMTNINPVSLRFMTSMAYLSNEIDKSSKDRLLSPLLQTPLEECQQLNR